MIIKSYEIKKNLKSNINIFLFYGKNFGLIEEIIEKDFKKSFSNNVHNYDESEILLNLNDFESKLFNKSFFDDDKLIIINRVTDKILDLIINISERKIKDVKIILKGGVLDKKSKLRIFFEKNKNLIATPFYEDANNSLFFISQDFLKKENIKISSQNLNFIIEKSKGDRANLKNYLEKIVNYSKGGKLIEFKQLIKLFNSSDNYEISELTDGYLSKNKKKLISILNEKSSSLDDAILIIKNFLYKLKRLKNLKNEMINKKNLDQVINSYKPSIFWKDKEIVKQQLEKFSLEKVNFLIKKVNNLEVQVKKNPQISNLLINGFIFEDFKSG